MKATREEQIYEHYRQWVERMGISTAAERDVYERMAGSIYPSASYQPPQRGHHPAGD